VHSAAGRADPGTGKAHAGAVFGFMNTAANLASSIAAVAFGYLVAYTGNYTAPFIPMLALLCLGAVMWLKLDPSRHLRRGRDDGAERGGRRACCLTRDRLRGQGRFRLR
jgi:hypothetical protein